MMAEFNPDAFRDSLRQNRNFRDQFKNVKNADRTHRRTAEQERLSPNDKKGTKPVFLRPNDIALGDNYDLERTLLTTLGLKPGEAPRKITHDDLRAFKKNIETLAERFKGGISVPQVINFSHADDITRANQQIHVAIPVSRKASVVHFITNAGPDSDVRQHHVHVEFLAFSSVVLDPEKQGRTTINNRLQNGKIKFECDCGRFKYWYRYIATLGNYVHGRKEGGFPKEKNPHVTGVACKHALRVMQFIRSANGGIYLNTAVENDRKKQYGARYATKTGDVEQLLDQQVKGQGKARQEIKPRLEAELKRLDQKAKAAAQRINANKTELQKLKDSLAAFNNPAIKASMPADLWQYNIDRINKEIARASAKVNKGSQ